MVWNEIVVLVVLHRYGQRLESWSTLEAWICMYDCKSIIPQRVRRRLRCDFGRMSPLLCFFYISICSSIFDNETKK